MPQKSFFFFQTIHFEWQSNLTAIIINNLSTGEKKEQSEINQ